MSKRRIYRDASVPIVDGEISVFGIRTGLPFGNNKIICFGKQPGRSLIGICVVCRKVSGNFSADMFGRCLKILSTECRVFCKAYCRIAILHRGSQKLEKVSRATSRVAGISVNVCPMQKFMPLRKIFDNIALDTSAKKLKKKDKRFKEGFHIRKTKQDIFLSDPHVEKMREA